MTKEIVPLVFNPFLSSVPRNLSKLGTDTVTFDLPPRYKARAVDMWDVNRYATGEKIVEGEIVETKLLE